MRIVQAAGKIEKGKGVLFFNEKDRNKGIDILKRSEAYMQSIRGNDISMIFQEAGTALNPVLSIGFQVGESFLLHRRGEMIKLAVKTLDKKIDENSNSLFRMWRKFHKRLLQNETDDLERYKTEIVKIDSDLYRTEGKTDSKSLEKHKRLLVNRERLNKQGLKVRLQLKTPIIRRYVRRINAAVREKVIELLTDLGVPNPGNIVDRYPHELSGGMQQRIVISIALACNPTLLIADEPTSNLDVTIQAQILDLLLELRERFAMAMLLISHDMGVVARMCDRISVMYVGKIIELADASVLYNSPRHPYTQALLQAVPVPDPSVKPKISIISGDMPSSIDIPSGCRFRTRCPMAFDKCAVEEPELETINQDGSKIACWLR